MKIFRLPVGLSLLPILGGAALGPAPGDAERQVCTALRCAGEIVNVKAAPYSARGDGSADDTAAIQGALDAANTVLVPAGTYVISLDGSGAGIRLLRDDVTLVLGAGATLRLKDGEIPVGAEGEVVAIGDGVTPIHDVTILGEGAIDGNRATNHGNVENSSGIRINAGATDVVVRDVTLQNVSGDAILMRGLATSRIDRVLVQGLHLEDCDEGILFKFSDNVQILGNRLENMDLQDAIEPHEDSQHWIVDGNTIDRVPNGQGLDPFNGARYGVISNNTIANAQQGMDLTSGGVWPPVTDVLVEGNVIHAATRESVYLPGNDARSDTRIVIRGNVIDSGGMYGVYVGPNLKGIRIEGNQITNTLQFKGIFADVGSQVDIVDNLVAGTGQHGIHHKGNDSLVSRNVVKNAGRDFPGEFPGIQLDGGNRLTCTDNATYDDQPTPTQYAGIWVRSSQSLVTGNTGFGNTYGLIYDARLAGTVIRDNPGYATEGQGVAVFTGNGVTKDFVLDHGLVCTPGFVLVSPASADAAGGSYWTADAGHVTVHFLKAPRSGSANVSVSWRASCP